MKPKFDISRALGARIRPALALLAALGGTAAGWAQAGAAPTGWKVGVAKEDMTPGEPVMMAGFEFRHQPSQGIRQHLFVRALAVEDERGRAAAIVTFDLAMIDLGMADAVAGQCRERYGLARDRLLMNVSHTHSGPVIGHRYYGPQTESRQRSTQLAIDQAVAAVGVAMHDLKPAKLEYGVGLAGIAVNRRRSPVFAGVPGGPVDPDVPVLAARDADGKLLAVVAGYACHATALMDYLLSNDWPGYAMEDLDRAHPGAMAFFVQGCGGDANAFPRSGEDLARDHGRVFAAAVEDVLQGRMTPLTGPLLSVFDRVDLPLHHAFTRAELQRQLTDPDANVQRRARRLLAGLGNADHTPSSYPYPIEVWQFGRGLTLIALGGEVVSDYALRLKRQYGFDHTWVAGYSNDIMSYIPSRRVLKEGGYEATGLPNPSPYSAAVEETLVEKVRELTQRVASADPASVR